MKLFKMDGLDGTPHQDIVLPDIWIHDFDERKLILDKMCQLVVDNFVNQTIRYKG